MGRKKERKKKKVVPRGETQERCGAFSGKGWEYDIYIYLYFRYLVESKYPSAGHFVHHLGNRALTTACLDEGRGWFGSGV